MSATGPAAVLLAAALLVAPAPARHRLGSPRRRTGAGRGAPVLALRRGAVPAAGVVLVWLHPAVAVAAGILAAALWQRVRAARRRRKAAAEGHALAEALEVMAGELRIGAHPVAALSTAARESAGDTAVAQALAAVGARARLGADVAAALAGAAQGSALPGQWHRLAALWQLAGTHGLAIAELIRAAHRDVAERRRYADAVSAQLAGARATTAILAGLPLVGIGLGQALGARPLAFLTGSGAGGGCLILGAGFLAAGLLWSGRLTDRLTT